MKKSLALSIIMLVLFSALACAIIGKQTYPFKMTDEWGNTIKFTKPPERIISCMPSVTEMLYALDAEDRIVGVTEHDNYPDGVMSKEKVGRDRMNLEKVVALKPDLIVMYGGAQGPDIKRFRSLGLPVFVVDPDTVRGVMYSLTLLGEAVNRPHVAYSLTERMNRKLNWVLARVKNSKKMRPTVFLEVWHKPLITAGGGTFLNDVIEKAGGKNIAKGAAGKYPEFSFEKLLAADPDVIIIPKQNVKSPEQIYNDGRWNKLQAVRNKRVLFIDADIISRPGPRIIKAVEEIGTFLYGWEGAKNEE